MRYNWSFILSLLWFTLSFTFYCLRKHEKQCRQNFAVVIFIYGGSMTAKAECRRKFRGLPFLISSWFNATVIMYWKSFLSLYWWGLLLLCCFLSNQENLYMIHHNQIYFMINKYTINKHNRRQTHYLSLILNYFDIYF